MAEAIGALRVDLSASAAQFKEADWSRFQQVVFSVELAQREKKSTITVHRASEPDSQAGSLPL